MTTPEEIPIDVIDDIRQVLLRVAPERAEELRVLIERLGLDFRVLNVQHETPFTANPRESRITCYFPPIVRQLVMAHSYVKAFRSRDREGDITAWNFMPDGDPVMESARDGLRWAMVDRYMVDQAKERREEPQPQKPPEDIICPDPTSPEDSDDRISAELAYVAIGADLHHELTHIKLEHGDPELTGEQKREQELLADAEAARWIVGGVPETAPEFEKRILGLALSQLYEMFMRLEGAREDDSHPPLTARLGDVLRNHVQSDDHIVWTFVASSLTLHLESANRPQHYDRERVFPTFRSLAEYLMSIFENR